MRKSISILLLLAAMVCPARAGMVLTGTYAGPSCTTSDDTAIISQTGGVSNAAFGYTAWVAARVELTATTLVTALSLNLRDLATVDSCTVTYSLYTHNGGTGKPDTEIAGTSVSIAESSIADGSQADYELALPSPVELSAGTYWIVFQNNHVSETTTTRYTYNATGGTSTYTVSSNSGSTWSIPGASIVNLKVMGCQ